jgi:glycerophosphoryl diester phosphodiesterase
MLELKIRGLAQPVTEIVQRSGFNSPVIYASFNHEELSRVREWLPSATIMPLIGRGPVDPRIPAKLSAHHIGIRFDRAAKPVVESLHAAGFHVFVFTVNDAEDIAHMSEIGIDGIISDTAPAFRWAL